MTTHARTLRLTDLPALALHSRRVYPNHAVTLEHCDDSERVRPSVWSLIQAALPRRRHIWISRDGGTLLGVASLRRRGGRSAWEIDTLISTMRNEAFLLDLLDRVVATAGADGAHRLFLRVATDSAALEPARRHGFAAVCEETLYRSTVPAERLREQIANSDRVPEEARQRVKADDHTLYRLYAAAVPQEVRWQTALSPAEWRAAQEPLGDHGREWVVECEDAALGAYVRVARGAAANRVTLLTDGTARQAQAAVAVALGQSRKGRRVEVLLPDHAIAETRAVLDLGLEPVAQYQLLARSIAQRASRLRLAEQSVEGSARTVIQ